MTVIPCATQIKMARAALGWSQFKLAEKSNLSVETIKRAETGANSTTTSLGLIAKAFEAHGVTFEPYDATQFNETGPIVRARLPVGPGFTAYGSKGQ